MWEYSGRQRTPSTIESKLFLNVCALEANFRLAVSRKMMEKDERGTGDPAFECTAITFNARRVDECAKARRREQRRSRKDSARQMESNDRDTRAARRVVGKRLTPWRRPAPPDTAHASYLKELTHPSSQCRPKTTVTSSFLTRCLWNPSSLCSLYPPFFSLLSSAFDFLL